ncbi:hypothetical protein B0H34DRAFT_683146 [Crassisporium funariophilum]|nr:hypothetical protein B0H34DRAFT_683146 [Crassisporium funariophilum]
MPTLDIRGKLAAAEIGFYAPIAVLSFILIVRYAFRRDAGWFFLFIFSAARMAGGALVVAGQLQPAKTDLLLAAYILENAALAPLLLSSLGFIGMAGQHTYSENPRVTISLRLLGFVGLAGLGLSIAGGILGSPMSPNQASIGLILRRAASGVFAGFYVVLFMVHIGTWTYRWHLRSYRRSLLWGISAALPFLGVRIAYAVLSAWSASDLYGTRPSSNPTLANFNPITGNWIFYLALGLVMEFVVAALYLFSSTILAKRHR